VAETQYPGQALILFTFELDDVGNVGMAIDGVSETIHYQEIDDGPGIFFLERPDDRCGKDDVADGTQPDDQNSQLAVHD